MMRSAAHPYLTRESDYLPMPIDDDGSLDLIGLFPDSIPGQRKRAGHTSAKRSW